jgi:hypothetical protein
VLKTVGLYFSQAIIWFAEESQGEGSAKDP